MIHVKILLNCFVLCYSLCKDKINQVSYVQILLHSTTCKNMVCQWTKSTKLSVSYKLSSHGSGSAYQEQSNIYIWFDLLSSYTIGGWLSRYQWFQLLYIILDSHFRLTSPTGCQWLQVQCIPVFFLQYYFAKLKQFALN